MCHYGNTWCRNMSDTTHECPPKPRHAAESDHEDKRCLVCGKRSGKAVCRGCASDMGY